MTDDVTSTHPQLIDPQGKCVTSWSVVLYASITISTSPPLFLDPLSVDKHLKMVREATWDVRPKWCNLGVQLGINVGTLEVNFVLYPRS